MLTHDENLNGILGLEPRETTGALHDPDFTRIHPDDQARVRDAIETAVATGADYSLEFRIVRADGRERWLRDRGRIVLGDNGTPLFATGAVLDITEQRRLEDHDRMLAAATQVLATSVDYEGTLVALPRTLVPRFADWASVHLSEGEGLRRIAAAGADDLAPDDRQVAEAISRGAAVREPQLLLLPLRAGANTIGVMTYAVSTRYFDVDAFAFAAELADRIALSIDRARLFRDLQRANRVKDEFLATLSHELRTPLNAVLGWTRMLQRGTVPPDRTQAILETIERNAAAQMQLVEELLDLSAMAGGGLRLNVTRVDLRELVGGAVETVRPAADGKTLRVKVTVSDSVKEIAGDPARLRQVLWNLLANAVKFTPAGGDIEVSVVDGPADVEITVRDTGPGIPPEFLPLVFEPFRQADSSSTRTVGGLGLGLAIVRHIVEAHGGTVTAQSDGPDGGSVFSVRLPTGRCARVCRGACWRRVAARPPRAGGGRRRVHAGARGDDAADVRRVGANRRPGLAGGGDPVRVAARRAARRHRDAGRGRLRPRPPRARASAATRQHPGGCADGVHRSAERADGVRGRLRRASRKAARAARAG